LCLRWHGASPQRHRPPWPRRDRVGSLRHAARRQFRLEKVAEARDGNATGYTLDLVPKNWLTPADVNRTEWHHWLLIVKPDELTHSTALLYLSGGSNQPGPPPNPGRDLVAIAKATHSVVVELRMVPNQPLGFRHDGVERKEDDLIAYSWDQFLRSGDGAGRRDCR